MTREEFIAKYERECSYYFDGYYAPCIQEFLNQIYDNFEEAMKPKTCMGCSNYSYEGNNVGICSYFTCPKTDMYLDKDFCCNKFEPKDNA